MHLRSVLALRTSHGHSLRFWVILRRSYMSERICGGYGSGRLLVDITRVTDRVCTYLPIHSGRQKLNLLARACLVPAQLQFSAMPLNPGISPPHKDPRGARPGATLGTGVSRTYFHNNVTNPAYPPRPVPGSVIDLDIVQDYCEFSTNQVWPLKLFSSVRSCLTSSDLNSM